MRKPFSIQFLFLLKKKKKKKKKKPKERSEFIQLKGTKKCRRRSKKALVEVIKNDMSNKEVKESMNLDRMEWGKRISVSILTNFLRIYS